MGRNHSIPDDYIEGNDTVDDVGMTSLSRGRGQDGQEELGGGMPIPNEESFMEGAADFEKEVVKHEETMFDDDIMHSLLQGINNNNQQK
jgi:hypothetical protein